MKIGLVLANTPAYSETFFRNKIRFLSEEGFEVVMFTDSNTNLFSGCITKVGYKFRMRSLSDMLHNFKLIFILLLNYKQTMKFYYLNKIDGFSLKNNIRSILLSSHIIGHQLNWLHFGFGTMAVGRENLANVIKAKMAVSFRGFDMYVYQIKHPDVYKCLYSKEAKYHVLSKEMKNKLVLNGLSSDSVNIISPAIDGKLFSNPKLRGKKEKGLMKIQLVTVSRLHWIKGLDYILEALALLKSKGVDFMFTIIGEGVEEERLKFSAYQLGIQDDVFFKGKLDQEEIKEYLIYADIYLQYSVQEGFCNAVLEAQAMGKICIVSDAEGLSENILNEITGFVVPKRNPFLLAQKIEEVLAMSEQTLDTMRSVAIRRVKDEFNIEKQKQEFLKFYA